MQKPLETNCFLEYALKNFTTLQKKNTNNYKLKCFISFAKYYNLNANLETFLETKLLY